MTEPPARYPGYDVLAKRATLSWDDTTRAVVDHRLGLRGPGRFFSDAERLVAQAVCRRILLQPSDRPEVDLAAMLDDKLARDSGDGFREASLPYMPEAWRLGLAAIDADSRQHHGGRGFAALDAPEQDALLRRMQKGEATGEAWTAIDARLFFAKRVLTDIPGLYYSHPAAWSEMGFGGPASPRGYVRMALDRRDPWEAAPTQAENKRVV